MDLLQAIKERHSVRQYLDKPIEAEKIARLTAFIDEINGESGLSFQLVTDEPKAFDSFMARYGSFSGVKNYVALVGKKGENAEEKIGYYGAKVVLFIQTLGLNTCWVAMSYKKIKTAFTVNEGEKIFSVLSVGYGKTQGAPHKSKSIEDVSKVNGSETPEWFIKGVNAALLAPTAINQQKFYFTLNADNTVSATTKGGFYTETDLGIAKYFFEIGAGENTVRWED